VPGFCKTLYFNNSNFGRSVELCYFAKWCYTLRQCGIIRQGL